jgi:ADP-heptose:LPS heptosyltransferase
VREHRKYGERHELEFNIRLLKQLGINYEVNEDNAEFGITPSQTSEKKIIDELKSVGINLLKPVIIIHPGSGGSSIDFPASKLKFLVESLSKLDIGILITGTASEKELCNSMVVSKNVINVAGRYSLSELIALINQSDLMIANSTGPIHIAAALNKYVIGFYPKIVSCAPKRWGPYTNKKIIFSPTIDCNDCNRSQCGKLNCMDSIKVDDVFTSTEILLRKISMEKSKHA